MNILLSYFVCSMFLRLLPLFCELFFVRGCFFVVIFGKVDFRLITTATPPPPRTYNIVVAQPGSYIAVQYLFQFFIICI
jgi:hypothetical protein